MDNISPEEKLLNLIKKNGDEKENNAEVSPEQTPLSDEADSAKKEPIATVKKHGPLRNNFLVYNKILLLLFVGFVALMVYGYLYPYKSTTNIPEKIKIVDSVDIVEEQINKMPEVSHYTNKLSGRNLFKIFETPKPKQQAPDKPKVTLAQVMAGYDFVGILFGDTPQAIVEEKRSGKSSYVSEGQKVGEVTVEKIEKGKVTVRYDEETMTINI